MKISINFLSYLAQFFFKMRNISDKCCRENQNTHFVLNNFFPENRAVHEIMRKSIVELGSPQMTIRCMSFACWIAKATHTHSRICHIYYFRTATMVCERASMLHYTYTACLVFSVNVGGENQQWSGLCPSREQAQWKRNTWEHSASKIVCSKCYLSSLIKSWFWDSSYHIGAITGHG
jgi:hypothetical protein